MKTISAEGLVVRYGSRTVLHGVSLAARAGEITAIVGPNASGKTTVLKALAGLVRFDGAVRYGADDARTLVHAERSRRVAYVPQRTELDAALTVREVVALGRFPHHGFSAPSRADEDAVERALSETRIEVLGPRSFPALSGGEQRRVLIARALATEAPVILLDEPTSSLDIAHVLATHELLRRLAGRGHIVVVVLHALDDVRVHTDRAFLLREGRVVQEGTSAEVVVRGYVRDVYDVELVEAGAVGFRRFEKAR
jgi:iron complex transport system ATP-binding protein